VENEGVRKENENKKLLYEPIGWDFGQAPKQTILPAPAISKCSYFIHQLLSPFSVLFTIYIILYWILCTYVHCEEHIDFLHIYVTCTGYSDLHWGRAVLQKKSVGGWVNDKLRARWKIYDEMCYMVGKESIVWVQPLSPSWNHTWLAKRMFLIELKSPPFSLE
jgi:hypothetical protein